MPVPLRQSIKVGTYLARQKLAGRDKFPLIVELEPLFACNLACNGCGKIQHPTEILRQRLTVEQAVAAIEECRAPMVSIAGGEPLLHPEIVEMTEALLDRGRFVYLCTNALLLERRLEKFTPHPRFAWVVHIDGLRERHDESVSREGTFDKAVAAIRKAKARGFTVNTNTTFFTNDSPDTVREVLDFLNDELKVDQMMISPGYAYEKAPDQVTSSGRPRPASSSPRRSPTGAASTGASTTARCSSTSWRGRSTSSAPPGASPATRCSAGRSRAISWPTATRETYQELIETTDWDRYGRGKDPRCANCMAHCGYEPTAVLATTKSLRQSLRAALSN